jgi:hypothetical protein
MKLHCPACQVEIPLADVHIANDIALCRACGKTHTYALVSSAGELGDVDIERIPRHLTLAPRSEGDVVVTYRRRSPLLFFLIPFTALWGGGSVGMMYILPLLKGQPLKDPWFGLPFLFGTLVLCTIIAFLLFGRWVVRVQDGKGSVFTGIGFLGWTRHFELQRGSVISLADCGAKVNDRTVPCIRVETSGTVCSFGAFIHDDSKRWIAARLRHYANSGR